MENQIQKQVQKIENKLTAETVRNYLVNGGGKVTDQEVMMFIELCKAQKLNPFTREAYLIKYGNSPANIVVGKDVFVKRAYRNPAYRGMKAGIVVVNNKGELEYREGSLKLPKEQLIGGWCEVYVDGHDFPIKSTVSMEEYSKNQSTWKSLPCVMIRKCAVVTALREAFPEDFQGLYDSSEIRTVPDELPTKEVEVGKATTSQKRGILKLAEMAGLYEDKNITELEKFCESNGYNLHDMTIDEAEEVSQLLQEYLHKNDEVVDISEEEISDIEEVEYQDIEEVEEEE